LRTACKHLTALMLVFALAISASRAHSSSVFYVIAHEDDWQLFMNPNAYYDVQNPLSKVIFIYVTAGDAGLGVEPAKSASVPYYVARENAANSAIRFMADIASPLKESTSNTAILNGHSIHRVIYKNTASYFLRLPDGNGDGSGFANTGNWSLQQFRSGQAAKGNAIDSSTIYVHWKDLAATVREMIVSEMVGATDATINIPESDAQLNIGSHPDHLNTSLLVEEAIDGLKCINRNFYLDYVTARKPINLFPEDQDIKSGVFAITAAAVSQFGYPSTWDPTHRSWLGRQYRRVEPPRCGN
jgi:GlcNAc-PI de-N-acetylase